MQPASPISVTLSGCLSLSVCLSCLHLPGVCLCSLSVFLSLQHGQTPLHLAAENDHSEVVTLFLKHRPELATLANMEGATCTHIAASKGSVAVIKELLKFNKGGMISAHNKVRPGVPFQLQIIVDDYLILFMLQILM